MTVGSFSIGIFLLLLLKPPKVEEVVQGVIDRCDFYSLPKQHVLGQLNLEHFIPGLDVAAGCELT